MNEEQLFQLKLNESIKDKIGTGGTFCMPMIITMLIFAWYSICIRRYRFVVLAMIFSALMQVFVIRKPFIDAFKAYRLKKRIMLGKSAVEVERRKIKSFDITKDVIEDNDGNIINVEYTTGDEYYYLACENDVTLVTVEGKVYAFAINRF
ncbi:hypothetical protein [Lachnobacterium bovis]|uniref:hypothetical protein n=1 Tax=Lachnobacterium bovis TaxID=140626 RepID=UPI00048444B5|nr:hypothetical protein [Lachnobacterium bovis]